MAVTHSGGTSSQVRLFLELPGQVMRVAQVGEFELDLKEPQAIEPGTEGTVVIYVDGRRREYPIVIQSVHEKVVKFDNVNIPDVPF